MKKTYLTTSRMVKIIFHYKNKTETDTLYMNQNEFVDISKRLFEKIGVLKVNSVRYDLTMVRVIEIHFVGDQETIV